MIKRSIPFFIFLLSLSPILKAQSLPPHYEASALSARHAFRIAAFLDQSPSAKSLDSTEVILQSLFLKEPHNPFLLYTLGKVYRLQGDLSKSDSAFARASRAAGKELILHGMLAMAFERDRILVKAEEEFQEVRNAMIERGITNIPALSIALVEQGQMFLNKGDAASAEKDFRRAIEFSPPLLVAHLSMVSLAPKGQLRETFLALSHGARPLWRNFENQLLLAANGFVLLLGILGAFSFGILGALILSYWTYLHHFLIERCPALFPRPARFLMATVLLVFALLLRPPLSLLLLLGISGVWVWLSKPERRLALFALAFLILIPAFLLVGAALFSPLNVQNPALILSRAQDTEPDILMTSRVRTMIARDPSDADLLLTAGLLAKRSGELNEARDDYLRHLAVAPGSYRGQINLGNIFFMQGHFDSAKNYYQKAVDLAPLSAAAHFNLSQAYLKKLDFHGAEEEFKISSKLDFQLSDRIASRSIKDSLLVVADETLPLSHLWDQVTKGYHFESLPGTLLREIFGFEPFLNPFISVLILFLMLFLRIAGRRLFLAEHCHACGRPVCPQCRPPERGDLCVRCARKIEGTTSPEMKETVLAAISARRSRFFLVRNVILSLLLPGSGHIYLGHLGRGVAFLLGASILFAFFRLRGHLIPSTPTLPSGFLASWLPVWWAAFALFYLLLLFSLRKLHLPAEEVGHGT